jgi:negative regulator of replication initiation
MQFHHVDVDDEVFAFVQQHAEPLVDDFNTTIKRLLGLAGQSAKPKSSQLKQSSTAIPGLSLPRDVPQSLRQIMEVAFLVYKQGESRTDATRMVAKRHRLAPQTVQDKYCRQLNLTAAKFDRLLDEVQLKTLREILHSKFFEHISLIDDVFLGRNAA